MRGNVWATSAMASRSQVWVTLSRFVPLLWFTLQAPEQQCNPTYTQCLNPASLPLNHFAIRIFLVYSD